MELVRQDKRKRDDLGDGRCRTIRQVKTTQSLRTLVHIPIADSDCTGQALIPSLLEQYDVHVLDIAPRPSSIPLLSSLTYHRGSIDPSSAALSKLFAKTKFDGIVHLAGVSLEEWCHPKEADCERVNVGGTRSLLQHVTKPHAKQGPRGRSPTPWVVLASSVDALVGSPMDGGRRLSSAMGKTKSAAEELLEEASMQNKMARFSVIRLDQVYGYPHSASIESTFLSSLITNALTGLPIQYSSDRVSRDYTHITDIVEGFKLAIDHVKRSPGINHVDLVSGHTRSEFELVDSVRRQTSTMSPIRDLGQNRAPTNPGYSPSSHGWKAKIDPEIGLSMMIRSLLADTQKYSLQNLAETCPESEHLEFAPPQTIIPQSPHPADQRNKDMSRLDGCTVNIGFNHDGFLHHLKCVDGKHCLADGVRVNGYNWNQTVWIVRKEVSGGRMNNRVRVRFEQENGMGWLGYKTGGKEVGLELYPKNEPGVQNVFDVEVSRSFW